MENVKNIGKLNPFYVTGFSDGESCFHLAIGKNSKYKNGYYVNPGFSITLHRKDKALLGKIQAYFGGIGTISLRSGKFVQFRVFSIEDLKVIINHFEDYPLITKKQMDFLLLKKALELIKNKEHLTFEGFRKIVSIRASMNKGLPESLKIAFPITDVILNTRPLAISSEIRDPNWVVGFTEAEGCFFVKIAYNKSKEKPSITLGVQITQHSRDTLLINSLTTFFNCGRVENCLRADALNFVVTKLSDITGNIIPFFENYPLVGSKAKDYEDFKKIAKLMTSKVHLTKEGLKEISLIKSGMNSSREHPPLSSMETRKKNSQYFNN